MSHHITHPFVLLGHGLSLTFDELALHVLALLGRKATAGLPCPRQGTNGVTGRYSMRRIVRMFTWVPEIRMVHQQIVHAQSSLIASGWCCPHKQPHWVMLFRSQRGYRRRAIARMTKSPPIPPRPECWRSLETDRIHQPDHEGDQCQIRGMPSTCLASGRLGIGGGQAKSGNCRRRRFDHENVDIHLALSFKRRPSRQVIGSGPGNRPDSL